MNFLLKVGRVAVVASLAMGAVVGVPAAAQAAVQVTSCPKTEEVCRDTQANFSASTATIKTISNGTTSTIKQLYTINKGVTGSEICRGTMGYNDQKSCNLNGYKGQLTATFYKGPGGLTTVSLR